MKNARHRPLRCAVYTRVSTDKQDVANSYDRQYRACADWAAKNGHVLVPGQVFTDEAVSGASTVARREFQRLQGLIRGRTTLPFDAVLVDDTSRIDRGGKLASIVEEFQARGVQLVSVDGKGDLTDESQQAMVHVSAMMNQMALGEISRRTRNGMASKVIAGFSPGGKVYGYDFRAEYPADIPPERRDAKNKIGTRITVNEDQAAIVLRIFREYVTGKGFRAIAVGLNEDGIPSARGGTWDLTAVRSMLLNPKYVGDWTWGRSKWKKKPEGMMSEAERERARVTGKHPRQRKPLDRDEWLTHRDDALRIIDDALWSEVQVRFKGRSRTTTGTDGYRRTRSPLAGVLRCSCGGNIGIVTNARKGNTYTRMVCPRHRNRGPDACGNSTAMRLEPVADKLLSQVRDLLLAPERVAATVEAVNGKIEALMSRDGIPAKVAALEAEIRRLEGEQDRLADALAKGRAYEAISKALDKTDARLRQAREELAGLASVDVPRALPRVEADDVRRRFRDLWNEIKKLDGDRARMALERLFGNITVLPLNGDWAAGWTLKMQTRPGVLVPQGAPVQIVGCGGPQRGSTNRPPPEAWFEVGRARRPQGASGNPV